MTLRPGRALALPLAACLTLCLTLCLALCPCVQAAQNRRASAPSVPANILSRLPHDAEAFTQGLLLHQGVLYESTGLYGQSSLRRVDPATGRVLARHDLPAEYFGEGLALCPQTARGENARLALLTWHEGVILTFDPATLRPLGRHRLRGQGWGLACRDGELALSDGSTTLRFLSARTLAETGRTVRVRDGVRPVPRLNELEWVNGWLLANIWEQDKIAVVRPGTGQVALWLDLSALRRELSARAEAANGIAYDPAAGAGRGALLLTGKRWETLFVVELPELLRRPPGP